MRARSAVSAARAAEPAAAAASALLRPADGAQPLWSRRRQLVRHEFLLHLPPWLPELLQWWLPKLRLLSVRQVHVRVYDVDGTCTLDEVHRAAAVAIATASAQPTLATQHATTQLAAASVAASAAATEPTVSASAALAAAVPADAGAHSAAAAPATVAAVPADLHQRLRDVCDRIHRMQRHVLRHRPGLLLRSDMRRRKRLSSRVGPQL